MPRGIRALESAVASSSTAARPRLAHAGHKGVRVGDQGTEYGGNTEQLTYHLGLAKQNGATEEERIEGITHLAFYAGWPKAMSAMAVAKQVFGRD
jgi:hypothetical protein